MIIPTFIYHNGAFISTFRPRKQTAKMFPNKLSIHLRIITHILSYTQKHYFLQTTNTVVFKKSVTSIYRVMTT